MMQPGEKPARDLKKENDEHLCWEMIDSVNSIVLRWDTDLRITFINGFALEFFGFRREDILGLSIVGTIVPPKSETGLDLEAMVRDIVRDPERFVNNENENIRRDGTRVWVSWTNRGIRDREGRIVEILSVGNDITRRKTAEEALKKQLEMTRILLDAIAVPVFYKDANGVYTGCNKAFAAFMGKPKGQIIGKSVYEVAPQDLAEIYHRADEELIHHPGTQVYESLVASGDGTRHDVIFSKATYFNEDGAAGGIIGTIIDVTRLKDTERELVKAREELEQRVRERTGELEQANEFLRREAIEHRRDEEALRESEERFRAVFDRAALGIAMANQDGYLVDSNSVYRGMLGYTRDELRQKRIYDVTYPEDVDRNRELERQLREGLIDKYHYQKRYVRKDGGIIWANVNVSAIRNPDGSLKYNVGVVEDITERKRAEKALLDSRARLNSIFRSAPTGIGIVANRIIQEANDRLCEMTGYPRAELIGKSSRMLYLSDAEYEYVGREKYEKIRREGTGSVETHWRRKDGEIRDIFLSSTPLERDNLQAGVTFTALDITERKQAEEEFRVLIESSPAAIFFHQGGNFIYVNPAAEKLSGYTKEQLLNMKFWEIIAPEYREMAIERGTARIRGERVLSRYEIRVLTSEGTGRWVEVNSTPMEYQGKMSALVIAIDITQRKMADEAMNKSRARAELYLDLMGHDISNMNQAMMGYLEMAQELLDLKGYEEMIERPLEIIRHSSRLIGNVKKLELIQAGKYPIKTVDMCQALKEACQAHAAVPGRDVMINLMPSEGCLVRANELLVDLFDNLVDNAIRHSEGPLTVDISIGPVMEDGRKYYMVSVADNGPGIPDDLKRMIFRFVDPATGIPGRRGLGLYMVQTLVESYHGRVWAEDRVPGDYRKGSRFVVLLPAAEETRRPGEDARTPV